MRVPTIAASLSVVSGIAAAADVPASYFYEGNIQAAGSNGCANVSGVFPAEIHYFQNTANGNVVGLYTNLQIYNNKLTASGSVTLPLQSLQLYFNYPSTPQATIVNDPQLFGTPAPQFGTYSGSIGFATSNGENVLDIGTNPTQPNATPVTLVSGSCTIALQGVLYASPE